jgi:hypothetical protein
MSECRVIRNLITLRPADRNDEEQSQVEAHLARCPTCTGLARAYARQDSLIGDTPGVGLTSAQRSRLLARIQKERGRNIMSLKLSTLLSTATYIVILVGLTLVIRVLLLHIGPPTPTMLPASHVTPYATPTATPTPSPAGTPEPIFAGEIQLKQAVDSLTHRPVPFVLGTPYPVGDLITGTLHTPAHVRFSLNWEVLSPPSAKWTVFVHLINAAGELATQSDAIVDWPTQPCTEGKPEQECTVSSNHEWDLPADFPAGTYIVVAGLYDSTTGARAPVSSPLGIMPPVSLGTVRVISDVPTNTPTPPAPTATPRPTSTPTPARSP